MRAARFHEYGPAEILVVDDAPEPHAGPGEIRIRAAAASVNPIDFKIRAGVLRDYYPAELPAIPGRDAAGAVDEVGDGVTGVAAGDRVFGLGGIFGASAEHVVLTAWAPVPDTWTLEQAAGAGLAVATAGGALNLLGDLSGKTLLVEGAAGGVGSAAVAIGVARGATVIGTASEAKHDYLRSIGALPTTYGPGLADRVAALAPTGVDAVLDAVGSGSLPDLVAIAGDPARVVTVADHMLAGGLGVRHYTAQNDSAVLAEGAGYGATGAYTPFVAETFPLEKIAEAHRYAERGRTQGKVIVTI
ncbi:putative alcohol dehydrogenase [Actinoplanes missouriensis 431]|uniref:Putative alcohol dehydrogenase n=1 Tax=Actinoplanes missouriensis (strain ATCC 14538 / DSM 43046 / CBS 188.64 / JCM 3121 / NBRC 102363 / NCIMB 12654 / NRRL B-3342 / UNCC 431) TaxID=512565 RepID=I0H567_ACTM4|nr:NADP-dependent oxidoreductase [Actinoplanes missouriensis]BAL88154.1 putative alcohol dehydrogenase [Actinoplanes missouriensis 431]